MIEAPTLAVPPKSASSSPSGPIAWYALGVLITAITLGFIDRQIIVLVAGPMKRDLGLDDFQIGALQGLAPALFAVLAGYPLAWLADRIDRRWVLIACILFWSAATAARGLAGNFNELLTFTVGIAVGEAVLTPIIYSLIPDLFSGRRRELANFIFLGAGVAGIGIGMMLGGVALGVVEQLRPSLPEGIRGLVGWRLVFFLVAAPGVIVALLVLPIPARRTSCGASVGGSGAGLLPYLRANMRAFVLIFCGLGFAGCALGVILTWLPIAIMRNLNAAAAEVGVRFGSTYSVAALLGVGVALATAGFWRRVAPGAHALRAMRVMMALAIFPMALFAFAASPGQAYLLVGALLLIFYAGMGFSPALLQDMAPPLLRARVSAMGMIIYTGGVAGGPMVIGALSEAVGEAQRALLIIIAILGSASFAIASVFLGLAEQPFARAQEWIEGR